MKIDWESILNSAHYLNPAWDRQKSAEPKSTPFCFTIKKLSIPYTGNRDEMAQKTYQVHLRFFDDTYDQFFGNTWSSPPLKGVCDAADKMFIKCNDSAFLHTSITAESIILVAEITATMPGASGVTKSLGWGFSYIFKRMDMEDCTSGVEPEPIDMKMYSGSCRALLYIQEPLEKQSTMRPLDGLHLELTAQTHKSFGNCMDLLQENYFLSNGDPLPGLQSGHNNLLKASRAEYDTFIVERLTVEFDPSLMEFETHLCENLNKDRIARDDRSQEKDTGRVEIVERRLRVGVHNGLIFTDDIEIANLICHDPDQRRSSTVKGKIRGHVRSGSGASTAPKNVLTAKNGVELEMPKDPNFALVFVLEYTVVEPLREEDRRLTNSMGPSGQQHHEIRWTSYLPFVDEDNLNNLGRGFSVQLVMNGGPKASNPQETLFYTEEECVSAIKLNLIFRQKLDPSQPLQAPIDTPIQVQYSKSVQRAPEIRPTNPLNRSEEKAYVVQKKPPRSAASETSEVIEGRSMYDKQMVTSPQVSLMPSPHMAQMLLYSQLIRSYTGTGGGVDTSTNDMSYEPLQESGRIPPFVMTAPALPMGIRIHTGTGLSRAAYAKLYTSGFKRMLDRNGDPPEVIDPIEEARFNVNAEIKDPLESNEIIFQFLAYAQMLNNKALDRRITNVYFTFQFYRFPQQTTQRLYLHEALDNITEDRRMVPYILQQMGKDGQPNTNEPPGLQIKYRVDPSFLKPGEGRIFLDHLHQQVLHIDVWDGDSLLLIGSCAVELKHLCRQGRESVQVTYELDVVPSADCGDEEFSHGLMNGHISELCGKLHLRMGNIGYSASSSRGTTTTVFVPEKRRTLVETRDNSKFTGGSLSRSKFGNSWSDFAPAAAESKRVTRAEAAVSSNRELAQLLDSRHHPNHNDTCVTNGTTKAITAGDGPDNGLQEEDQVLCGQAEDAERRRKLARMEAIRKVENKNPTAVSILSYRENKTERMRDLRTIDIYRTKNKRDSILQMLSDGVCAEHTVYPSFGATEFFEFELKNPYNVEQTILIQINDLNNSLSVVTDIRELCALKLMFAINTPTEPDLITWNESFEHFSVFLRPKEKVLIPFRFVELGYDSNGTTQGPVNDRHNNAKPLLQTPNEDHSIRVNFMSTSKQTIGLLSVRVAAQPAIIDQAFRFYQPEQSFLKKMIRLPALSSSLDLIGKQGGESAVYMRSSDSNVICESKPVHPGEPHDVFIKVSCGPSPQIRQFLVAVYVDPFRLRPAQVWQFVVHSQERVDVSCVEQQVSHLNLMVKGTSATRQVSVYTSHPMEISVQPAGPITLTAGTAHELQVTLCPTRAGSRLFNINVVDREFHQVVRAWLVCAQVRTPDISKCLEVSLPVGGGPGSNKRVAYTNPYSHEKTFYLATNRPEFLTFKESTMTVGGGESVQIGLRFLPCGIQGSQDILVFLNDEEGKNEEAFSIAANYS